MTRVVTKSAAGGETGRAEYGYDSLHRRSRAFEGMRTIYWSYDGLNPALKLSNAGVPISRRMYSRGLDAVLADDHQGTARWFITDQVGSVRDLISNGASVLNHYSYDSFGSIPGRVTSSEDNDLLFNGREFSGDGAIAWLRLRWYEPRSGRFQAEDLIGPRSYVYADANPVAYSDPIGLNAVEAVVLHGRIAMQVFWKSQFIRQFVNLQVTAVLVHRAINNYETCRTNTPENVCRLRFYQEAGLATAAGALFGLGGITNGWYIWLLANLAGIPFY